MLGRLKASVGLGPKATKKPKAAPAAVPAAAEELPLVPVPTAAENAAEAQAWIAAWKQRTGGFKAKKRFFGLF